MTSRATAKAVALAFNSWARVLDSKGGHIDGLKLTREGDVWRIVGASDTTPIPCGDTRGFLGDSTRSALDALRRSTTQLGMLPAEHTVKDELLPWLSLFNESEIEGCREENRRRLQAMAPGQTTAMRAVCIPKDAAVVVFEDERYTLMTGMNYWAKRPSKVTMDVALLHTGGGKNILKPLNRIHRLRVSPVVPTED